MYVSPRFTQPNTPKQVGVIQPITQASAAHFMQLLADCQRLNAPSLSVVISCDGGSIEPAFTMRAGIEGAEGLIVSTHNIYTADSSAALLFLSAKRRIVSPGASFLLHDVLHRLSKEAGAVTLRGSGVREMAADNERKYAQLRDAFIEGGIAEKDIDRYLTFGHCLSANDALSIGFATHKDVYRMPKGTEYVPLTT